MPNINIDDAYILNETGAQVDKVTGLYFKDESTSAAEKAFAQLNIGTAGSNRNLLDNPFFTVRQRGDGPFGAGAGYTVDRWTKFYNGIITATDNGVSIAPNTTSGWIEFAQYLPADMGAALEGKTLTLSALLQDGTLYSKSGVCAAKPSSGTTNFITISMPNSMGFVAGRRNDGALRIEFTYGQAYSQDPLNVRAVKLELGSVSTLANDAPPKYEQALLDCEYRCVVYDLPTNTLLCRGIATSTTNIAGVIDLPRDMAEDKTPTVSITGSLTTPAGNTITAVSAATYARKNKLRVNFTGTGFTGGTVYDIFTGTSTPKITISADL